MPIRRPFAWLLSFTVVFGALIAGCSDDTKPQTVVPEQAPTERSKDSMEFHKKEMEAAAKNPR